MNTLRIKTVTIGLLSALLTLIVILGVILASRTGSQQRTGPPLFVYISSLLPILGLLLYVWNHQEFAQQFVLELWSRMVPRWRGTVEPDVAGPRVAAAQRPNHLQRPQALNVSTLQMISDGGIWVG